MSRKQCGKPVRGNRKCELERKRDERAARRALAKDRKNRPPVEDEAEEFVSFSNQLKALGLKLREVPGDGYVHHQLLFPVISVHALPLHIPRKATVYCHRGGCHKHKHTVPVLYSFSKNVKVMFM